MFLSSDSTCTYVPVSEVFARSDRRKETPWLYLMPGGVFLRTTEDTTIDG